MWPHHPLSTPYQHAGITEKQWTDWQWQLSQTIRTLPQLERYLALDPERLSTLRELYSSTDTNLGTLRLTPYLVSLINPLDTHDPIGQQHLPVKEELSADDFKLNEVWEQSEDFLDDGNRMIQQKYPDIILLRISNTCHSFCRFCFEKERTLLHGVPTHSGPKEFAEAVEHIRRDTRVRQVLLSGGDPLIIPDRLIAERLEALITIPHLRTIRLNTRSLTHNPYRITPELTKLLQDIQHKSWQNRERGISIEIGVHFNHPQELTILAIHALRELQRAGIPIYNQTVLLKGINDDVNILQQLFRILREEGVRLHYLSQAMAVPGTTHFRTSVRRGQELMRELRHLQEFRGQLPHFELSHHTGKQIIPDTMNEFFYEETTERNGKPYRSIKFLSDITGNWETFPDGD